jgi:ribose-phosphate pyrophosphokinase
MLCHFVAVPLPYLQLLLVLQCLKFDLVVFPDESAQYRYSSLIEIPSIFSSKVRDQLTGEITGMEMPEINSGQNILVIDDIADGARTPIEVAKLISEYNPNYLGLYVSHGIFSKGTKIVYEAGYNEIYTREGIDLSNPFN